MTYGVHSIFLIFQGLDGLFMSLMIVLESPRVWFGRFTKVMLAMGYKQSQRDHTLFIMHSDSGGVIVLLVYVDDIIVIGNDEKARQALK